MRIRKFLLMAAWGLWAGQASAQDAQPRALQNVELFSFIDGTTQTLVMKNGGSYFKIVCDDLNRLANMVESLGFDAKASVYEVDEEHPDRGTITTALKDKDALRCKGYVPLTGESVNRYFYAQYTPKVNNVPDLSKQAFFIQHIKGVTSTLFEMKCRDNVVAALDLRTVPSGGPSTVTEAQFNGAKAPFQCGDGVRPATPTGQIFSKEHDSRTVIAGDMVSAPLPLVLPDAAVLHVKRKTCEWLTWNAATHRIEGKSYPATVPYACEVELLGETTRAPETYKLTVQVEPIKIEQITSGYRKVCALLNNGRVSCVGAKENLTPAAGTTQFISHDIEAARGATHIALSLSNVPRYQVLYFVRNNELFAYKDGSVSRLAAVSDVKRLKAGAEPVCVESLNGQVTCFGENLAQYRLSSTPTPYLNFDFGYGDFCGQKTGETAITCNVNRYTVQPSANYVPPYAVAFDGVCSIQLDGKLFCDSTNNANPLKIHHSDGNLTQLAVGPNFGCSVDIFNKMQCWGRETVGQTLAQFSLSEQTKAMTIRDLRLGYDHGCYLTSTAQTMVCWGGQFFNDDTVNGMKRRMDVNMLLPSLAGWEVAP